MQSDLFAKGSLRLMKFTPKKELSFFDQIRYGVPQFGLSKEINSWRFRNQINLWRGLLKILIAKLFGLPHFYGQLFLVLNRNGQSIPLGLAGLRVVTSAGVNYIAADIAGGASDSSNFKYHGFGTGTNAEASGDTTLQTELTTQYASDSTRPTGSQTSSTNTYTTVATLSPDSGGTLAITEHGIFSATSSGTLLDRTVFSAVNLVAGSDSLQATYVLTLSAGG